MTDIQELIKKGELDKAIEISFERYKETGDEKIYNLYGIALFKKGRYSEAAEVFGELYSKYPENEKLAINYAQALIEAGRIEEAERILREGAMIFPESEKFLELIAECERRKTAKKEEKFEEKIEEEKIEKAEEEKIEELEEQKLMGQEPEELQEKIQELEHEIEIEEERRFEGEGKKVKGEEKVLKEVEEEKLSLEHGMEIFDGFLKRARIVELTLQGNIDFIARSTFIISVSGIYKVFPLNERHMGKIRSSPFGGKEQPFIKIRGENSSVIMGGEYISLIDISEIGKLAILEPYLTGFESDIRYNVIQVKLKKFGKIKIVELEGKGKVLIFSAGKKLMMKEFDERAKVAIPNFVGLYGEGEISFLTDSVQIVGSGKVILRI